MPRVKIDYVVSFSNEDPENQARNLLSWEVSKKKWLCSKGEGSCSVVLQLARAVKISAVQIGAHHAALVEVLVGRSETPTEPFQVLVPSSVLLSPAESRGAAPVDRVRSFAGAALAAASAQRWDRLRIVCSQPYNKHCKYGLSFIQIFEPEGEVAPAPAPAPAPAVPARLLALDTFSSDEEEFRPGELFAKHRQSGGAGDTGAQIRQATSQALKNNPDAATKLMKASLKKNKPTTSSERTEPRPRDSDSLMYTVDDERPHAKIDRIVQRHKDDNCKDEAKTPKPKEKDQDKVDKTRLKKEESSSSSSESKREGDDKKHADRSEAARASSNKNKDESRKRTHSDRKRVENGGGEEEEEEEEEELRPGPQSERPLAGVVFVLSGYVNPRRGRLRELALSLGARARREWGPACSHLICAFSNTPKLKAVRALPAGAAVPAPTAEWLEECARRRRRLPWRWFAAEPARRVPAPPHDSTPDSECDTDDDIEEVLRQQKKARAAPSPSPRGGSDDSDDVEFVKDERMQGNITVEESESEGPEGDGDGDGDTDVEEVAGGGARRLRPALPALFAGAGFLLHERRLAPLDARLLARYCIAYGGLVLNPSDVDEDSGDYYVLCGSSAGVGAGAADEVGRLVRADWVWACHDAAALCPLDDYLLRV